MSIHNHQSLNLAKRVKPWIVSVLGALLLLPLFGLSIYAARSLGIDIPVIITEDTSDLVPAALRLIFGLSYAVAVGVILFRSRSIKVGLWLIAIHVIGNFLSFGAFHLASHFGITYSGNHSVIFLTAIMALIQFGILLAVATKSTCFRTSMTGEDRHG
jgi:hypothetical protein